MNDVPADNPGALAAKIARLVEERGWNQEDFARLAKLNRLTVRQILQAGSRRLHNATVGACARALGLTVNDLRTQPLEALLPRMHPMSNVPSADPVRRLYEEATQPELVAWMQRDPDAAARLTAEEMDELLSLQRTGGPLTRDGLEQFLQLLDRRRALRFKVETVAGTEYLELLEKFVEVLYEKIQPYRDRAGNGSSTAARGD